MRRLAGVPGNDVTRTLESWLLPYEGRNAFNPSILSTGGTLHVTFRAFREADESKPFNAYYMSGRPSTVPGAVPTAIDLTAIAADHGVAPVADPKLFRLGERVLVTFNTGHRPSGPNDVYVMQVHPTPGPPQRCELDQRQRTEKNWAFYESGGRLKVIYSLDPLVRLEMTAGTPGERGALRFSRHSADVAAAGGDVGAAPKRSLSIGTQPVETGGDLLLVAHEKVHLARWRGYLGRLVRITQTDGVVQVTMSPARLIHSAGGLLPRPGRHNPNALFVTYFAGITWHEGHLLVGYGVNDRTARFAALPAELLEW